MDTFRKIFYPIESLIYIILAILAIVTIAGGAHYWDITQANTLLVGALTGAVGIFLPPLLEKILKCKFSHLIDFVLAVDLFFSIVLGEALMCYRTIPNYDKFLHFFATAELVLLGYLIAKFFLNKKTKEGSSNVALALVFGFFFAFTIECAWEIYEFLMDEFAGTNMQKYIPHEFLDTIDADKNLTVSAEEILAFYSTPEGYRFAVSDTMWDIFIDLFGGLFGVVACGVYFKKFPQMQDRIIYKPEAVLEEHNITEEQQTDTINTEK